MPELGQITLRKPSPYRTSRHIAFGPEADQSKFDCKLVLSDDPISRPNVVDRIYEGAGTLRDYCRCWHFTI